MGSEDLYKVFYILENPSINGWPLIGLWTLLPEDLYKNCIFGENPFDKWLTSNRSLKTSTGLHDYEDRVEVLFRKQTFYMSSVFRRLRECLKQTSYMDSASRGLENTFLPSSSLEFRKPLEFLYIQSTFKKFMASEDLYKVYYILENPSINGL